MKRRRFTAALGATLVGLSGCSEDDRGVNDHSEVEAEFIDLLDEERNSRGHQSVRQRDVLTEMGEDHTQDMAENTYFSHTDSRGRTIEDRYRKRGLLPECELPTGNGNEYYPGAENLGQTWVSKKVDPDYSDGTIRITTERELAEDLFRMWMNSTGHREAMLVPSASEAGLGLTITDEGKVYAALELC